MGVSGHEKSKVGGGGVMGMRCESGCTRSPKRDWGGRERVGGGGVVGVTVRDCLCCFPGTE